MNEPVRILADWLNGQTSGSTSVTAVLQLSDFPKDGSDSLPSAPTHYDSTRHGFAARGVFPKDSSVTYPCVVVGFGGLRYDVAEQTHTANAKLQAGTCTLHVTVAHRLQDSDEGVEDVDYLVRAVKGSLTLFDAPGGLAARARNGFQLLAIQRVALSPITAEDDDKLIGTQFTIDFLTHESTPA